MKNCTDEIQPIDAGYGQIVRRLVGEAFLRWLDSPDVDPHSKMLNVEMWETPTMLPAYKRRVLMTEWVAEAVVEAMDGYSGDPCRARPRLSPAKKFQKVPNAEQWRM